MFAQAEASARVTRPGGLARASAGAMFLVAVTSLTYIPAIRAGFIWDDDDYVTKNQTLRSLEGLGRIWLAPGAVPQYYPLVHTTFWAEYHLWGLDPVGYHVVNVFVHALGAVLLWRLLRRLGVPGAYLAAAIFALHPVHVESVAWITERKNVLSMVFYLLAFGAYLRFSPVEGESGPRRWGWCAGALALFLGALLSKTVTASLPAAALLVVWWKRGRITWRDVWPLIPFFVIGAGLGLVTAWMETHHVGAEGAEWDLSWLERCLVAGRAVWFYAGKLLWPANLIFIYPRWQIDAGAGWQYLYPAALAAVLAALAILRKRIGRAPIAAALFFVGTLAPALGFVNVYPFRYSFVADHFQYHASVGLIALAAGVAATAAQRLGTWARRGGYAAAGGVLLALGALTWQQCYIYKNLETLWTETLARNPQCWMAHNNLGLVRYDQARITDAVAQLAKAVALKPDDPDYRMNLGCLLDAQGRSAEARVQFTEAIRIEPTLADAHNMLGTTLFKEGRTAEALVHFEEAVRLRPAYPEARNNVAFLLCGQGKFREAEAHAALAVRLKPDYAEVHNTLGIALGQQGKHAPALAQFAEAIRLKPDHAGAHYNLGTELASAGQFAGALPYLAQAVRLEPRNPLYRLERGNALAALGRTDEALAHFAEALRLDPNYAAAYYQMGRISWQRRDAPQAVRYLREAIARKRDYPAALERLAWVLATDPDAKVRSGAEAVQSAERAVALTGRKDPSCLDALAAAYAEAGRFPDAVAAAKEAVALAAGRGPKELAAQIERRLALYQAGQPYREAAAPPAGGP